MTIGRGFEDYRDYVRKGQAPKMKLAPQEVWYSRVYDSIFVLQKQDHFLQIEYNIQPFSSEFEERDVCKMLVPFAVYVSQFLDDPHSVYICEL